MTENTENTEKIEETEETEETPKTTRKAAVVTHTGKKPKLPPKPNTDNTFGSAGNPPEPPPLPDQEPKPQAPDENPVPLTPPTPEPSPNSVAAWEFPGLRVRQENHFKNKHRQRGAYIEHELDAILRQQQEIQGKGTVTRIINDALREYFKKHRITYIERTDGPAQHNQK